jgi:hypothetical protein
MTDKEALRMALEKVANALPAYIEDTPAREYLAVIHSALAAPVQEPVAWDRPIIYTPPHMAPPAAKQPWIGLTDEEIAEIYLVNTDKPLKPEWLFARAIEDKLKERNQ